MIRDLAIYRRGRFVSNWPAVLLMGLVVGAVAGLAYATVRWVLNGHFSFVSIVFAVFLSIGAFAGLSMRKCYMLQPEYGAANRRHRERR
ncbi:MAG TPA: hypothetical protein VGQ99_13925 [Tepidisphaeraceae bacterium]|jgi:hypothetical protein|nr:hypothetical protein [Tepidisphaeraceae bacterium]